MLHSKHKQNFVCSCGYELSLVYFNLKQDVFAH